MYTSNINRVGDVYTANNRKLTADVTDRMENITFLGKMDVSRKIEKVYFPHLYTAYVLPTKTEGDKRF